MVELAGLFLSAFVAATLLPMQSEALLAGLVVFAKQPVWLLVLVASIGNIGGALVNWWLGTKLTLFRDRKWFPFTGEQLEKASRWYGRYGKWSLLVSWAPIIGDPLTLAAGLMREPLWRFLVLVTLAKTGRYVFIAAFASQFV